MYIVNPEAIKNKVKYKGALARYFLDHGVPLLSKEGEYYYFADSKVYQECLFYAPIWVKWAIKFGI